MPWSTGKGTREKMGESVPEKLPSIFYLSDPPDKIQLMAAELYVREASQTLKMPNWFRDFVTLGTIIGNWDNSKGRLVNVISCPTSRYASCAISLGIAWAESKRLRKESNQEKFSQLNNIQIGEFISIRANTKRVIGRFLGIENQNEIRLDGSRYLLSKIEEIHRVKSISNPRSQSLVSDSKFGPLDKFMDPNRTLSTLAQSLIALVGDKESVKQDFEVEVGIKVNNLDQESFQKLSEFVKIKDDSRYFGWSCELLSVDELLFLGNIVTDTHLILANNRACIELAEFQNFRSKTFLLDSRDSLIMAQDAIQRYSRYCEKIDVSVLNWKPHKAFRGLVMVDRNV